MKVLKISAAIAMSAAANILTVLAIELMTEKPKPRAPRTKVRLPEESSWRALFHPDYEAE